MKSYRTLSKKVLQRGVRKPNRTGVDTLSLFNYNYSVNLDKGFPLLSTKEMSWKNIVVELLWFMSGAKDISFLRAHGCKFWDPWADEHGTVPSNYGHHWRQFPSSAGPIDQIAQVVQTLRQTPESRRLVVSAWDPGHAWTSPLPPCHAFMVFNSYHLNGAQRLSLHLTQRSADIALGVPYNIASYALLLHLVAQFTGLRPHKFAHSIVDAHIYTASLDGSNKEWDHTVALREQIERPIRARPTLRLSKRLADLSDLEPLYAETDTKKLMAHFELAGYNPHPPVYYKVAV